MFLGSLYFTNISGGTELWGIPWCGSYNALILKLKPFLKVLFTLITYLYIRVNPYNFTFPLSSLPLPLSAIWSTLRMLVVIVINKCICQSMEGDYSSWIFVYLTKDKLIVKIAAECAKHKLFNSKIILRILK